jgi:hypothetical protein
MDENIRHEAPGRLEIIREFLNTWRIANTTHLPEDLLSSGEALHQFQRTYFPALPATSDPEEVLRLRSDLRTLLGASQTSMVTTLNPWLVRYPIVTVLEERQEPIHVGLPQVYYRPLAGTIDRQSLCAELLSIVIEALALHTWTRLKACLDCQWVFYDRSKNTSKLWCGMLAEGPLGRSCGSIAKVRRWRERQKGLK